MHPEKEIQDLLSEANSAIMPDDRASHNEPRASLRVPFNQPFFSGNEFQYIFDAIRRSHLSGDGHYTKQCHRFLEEKLGAGKALLTTSCTHALEMAALLLNIQPGDEVIVPSFTFVSTVNAFVLRGAKPVFIDIRPDTLNLDETKLESLISKRTRAIIPVHYAGISCEMETILEVAHQHGVSVVEDNAHGLFGKFKGRFLGSFGAMATQSFHETKNFSCGEGGALLLNDPLLFERAEILREKGTDRSRFFRGQVDKYGWVDLGSSYLPSDLLAAFLFAQLESHETIQRRRKKLFEGYQTALSEWANRYEIAMPVVPEHCEPSYHLFYLLMPSLEIRTRFIQHLKEKQVAAVFHYVPLHNSEMGKKLGGNDGDCPVTENVAERLVRLPFFNDLSSREQDRVIQAVTSFVP